MGEKINILDVSARDGLQADAEVLAAHFCKFPDVRFSALVPNVKGYERAVASGVRYLEFVLSASDSFNRKNLNRTLPESLALLAEVSRAAERDGVTIRTGISTSFHCPFEGTISAKAFLAVVKAARDVALWRVAMQRRFIASFPAGRATGGDQHLTGRSFQLDGEAAIPATPAPSLSEHTATWLGRLGYDEDQIAALRAKGTV